VWWLIGLAVLAVAVAIALIMRRRNRKRAWADEFTAARGEVTWFARELIPRLERAPTAQQIAGGWRIEADRIVAAEDHLTALEASAVDETSRGQARSLRDAVRTSRTSLARLADTGDTATAESLLRSVAARLEAALAPVDRGHTP
jgi:hypothetical protein